MNKSDDLGSPNSIRGTRYALTRKTVYIVSGGRSNPPDVPSICSIPINSTKTRWSPWTVVREDAWKTQRKRCAGRRIGLYVSPKR